MYVYTVQVQIAGGRAECPRHHGGPAGRRAGAHVCACMSIQYKYRQISSGAGATRRVDAPNVRDKNVCLYSTSTSTDLFWHRRRVGTRGRRPRGPTMGGESQAGPATARRGYFSGTFGAIVV